MGQREERKKKVRIRNSVELYSLKINLIKSKYTINGINGVDLLRHKWPKL